MQRAEKAIIEAIQRLRATPRPSFQDKWRIEQQLKNFLDTLDRQSPSRDFASADFISNTDLNWFITIITNKSFLQLRLFIEDYLIVKNNPALKAEKLKAVEETLKTCTSGSSMSQTKKRAGLALLSYELTRPTLIRNVLLTNDKDLSELFLKYLPTPRTNIFAGYPVPKIITDQEEAAAKTIKVWLEPKQADLDLVKTKNDPFAAENLLRNGRQKLVERAVIQSQRTWRAKKRQKQELNRIAAPEKLKDFVAASKPNHGVLYPPDSVDCDDSDEWEAKERARWETREKFVSKKIIPAQKAWREWVKRRRESADYTPKPTLAQEKAQQLLTDANTPYMPKCDLLLAQRLQRTAEKIKLFSVVKHLTAPSVLASIESVHQTVSA